LQHNGEVERRFVMIRPRGDYTSKRLCRPGQIMRILPQQTKQEPSGGMGRVEGRGSFQRRQYAGRIAQMSLHDARPIRQLGSRGRRLRRRVGSGGTLEGNPRRCLVDRLEPMAEHLPTGSVVGKPLEPNQHGIGFGIAAFEQQ